MAKNKNSSIYTAVALSCSLFVGPALTESANASEVMLLSPLAVYIDRTPPQPWPGYGVYLGNGYVLTAAHVTGNPRETQPHVVISGKVLSANPVRVGAFETDDLTILRLDSRRLPKSQRVRHVVLCSSLPALNSAVVVVTPTTSIVAHLIQPSILPAGVVSRYPTLIDNATLTGNSGSGVFDPRSSCLLGIVSRKITLNGSVLQEGRREQKSIDIAKYFVPFTKIRSILPPDVRY